MQLSFGEQVKIVLKRQGITIKELASRIEEQTGKKMSRQNLTQRLGRDNFQEQDMFMVARALGCSLTINLIDGNEAEAEPAEVRTAPAAESAEVQTAAASIAPEEIAESVEMLEFESDFEEENLNSSDAELTPEPIEEPAMDGAGEEEPEAQEIPAQEEERRSRFSPLTWYKKNRRREEAVQPAAEPAEEPEEQPEEPVEEIEEQPLSHEELMRELNADIAALGDAGTIELDDIPERGRFETDPEAEQAFEREKEALLEAQREDRNAELPPDQLPTTSVNPYTLREYKSNTVRAHASRIGYVQVYSRQEHAWKDMTEWAFMGEQDRRKALLGDQYEEPTYLD